MIGQSWNRDEGPGETTFSPWHPPNHPPTNKGIHCLPSVKSTKGLSTSSLGYTSQNSQRYSNQKEDNSDSRNVWVWKQSGLNDLISPYLLLPFDKKKKKKSIFIPCACVTENIMWEKKPSLYKKNQYSYWENKLELLIRQNEIKRWSLAQNRFSSTYLHPPIYLYIYLCILSGVSLKIHH